MEKITSNEEPSLNSVVRLLSEYFWLLNQQPLDAGETWEDRQISAGHFYKDNIADANIPHDVLAKAFYLVYPEE